MKTLPKAKARTTPAARKTAKTQAPGEAIPGFMERMRLHRERMQQLGVSGPQTPKAADRLNRIIAGEE